MSENKTTGPLPPVKVLRINVRDITPLISKRWDGEATRLLRQKFLASRENYEDRMPRSNVGTDA